MSEEKGYGQGSAEEFERVRQTDNQIRVEDGLQDAGLSVKKSLELNALGLPVGIEYGQNVDRARG